MGYWNLYDYESNGPIINSIWPNGSYDECDISSITGSRCSVSFLKVSRNDAAKVYCAVRPKGDVGKYYDAACNNGQRGFHSSVVSDSANEIGIIAISNDDGIFEYTGNGLIAIADLIGWFIPTSNVLKHIYNGVMPIVYTDVGSEIITQKALMFLRCDTSINGDFIAVREDGDTDDYLGLTGQEGSVSTVGDADIANIVETLCVKSTDTQLKFEQISDNSAGGPPTVDLDCIAYENEAFVDCDVNIVTLGLGGYNWQEFDISSELNNKVPALCVYRVYVNGIVSCTIGIRPANETKIWYESGSEPVGNGCNTVKVDKTISYLIICPTDPDGKIEVFITGAAPSTKYIDLIGYIPISIGILSVVPSYLSLRVNFTKPMIDNNELIDISNYYLESVVPTSVGTKIISITPESVTNPTYIDIECNDVTHSGQYKLTITPSVLQSTDLEYLVNNNIKYFDGVSDAPIIQSIRAISNNQMQVIFSKLMEYYNISDPTRYTFDKGLSVLSVTIISPGIINLLTTKQVPNEYYTLTIS